MKQKAASSPPEGKNTTPGKPGGKVSWKAPAKPVAPAARRATGGVRYIDLGSKSGKPGPLSASEAMTTKRPFISVFHVTDRATVAKSVKLARQAPHVGHPTVAVVSPRLFNEPDLRQTLLAEYSEVLVEEAKDIAIPRFVEILQKSNRQALARSVGKQGKAPDAAVAAEAATTDLSARLRDAASGRLDARKISELLGITLTDLATKVCGVTKQALSQSPTSTGIQEKLQPLEEVALLLHWCGGDEAKLRAWLHRPNRDFPEVGGKTPSPLDLILRGHAGIVARKVLNLLTGHPA